jgi:hypothetical protein
MALKAHKNDNLRVDALRPCTWVAEAASGQARTTQKGRKKSHEKRPRLEHDAEAIPLHCRTM